MKKRVLGLLALGLLALVLGGCRVILTPDETDLGFSWRYTHGDVIQRFEPDRGPGAVYRVGEEVRFYLWLRKSGYVTLVVRDPDGARYALERELWLPAGWNELPPPGRVYRADYPTGLHRVYAYYASARGRVHLGFYGSSSGASAASIRVDQDVVEDVASTYLYVAP